MVWRLHHFFWLFLLISAYQQEYAAMSCSQLSDFQKRSIICKQRRIGKNSVPHKIGYFLGDIVADALLLHRYLFTVDSAKILTAATPFYLVTRQLDEDIQSRFYDPTCHTNINQFPKKCHQVAKNGVGIPMVALSSLALWGWSEDIRVTARIFAIGLPFVHSGKDIIKKLRAKACLRPWHEDFDSKKRSSGGFPSGHMANVTYMATLWGMRHGLRWGAPLGLFATFVFADFVNCNRHYVSQIIAGAAFGVLYAFAADKLIEQRLFENWCVNVDADVHGNTTVKVGYSF